MSCWREGRRAGRSLRAHPARREEDRGGSPRGGGRRPAGSRLLRTRRRGDAWIPYRSAGRERLAGRSEELERLAVEMYARGLSTRDIEATFTDAEGGTLLSPTAVSEVTEKLWAEDEAFATRDLSEYELLYLFVDGVAERLHPGQRREAVLCAWGIDVDGKKVLLGLVPERGGHGGLPRVLPGYAATRTRRSAAGCHRRGAGGLRRVEPSEAARWSRTPTRSPIGTPPSASSTRRSLPRRPRTGGVISEQAGLRYVRG